MVALYIGLNMLNSKYGRCILGIFLSKINLVKRRKNGRLQSKTRRTTQRA